jgi:L-fucose isomerase-like protein
MAILVLTSKGAAAVAGGAFICLAATLSSVDKVPVAALLQLPQELHREEPEIGTLGVLGTVLGEEHCFGAVKGKVNPGPLTYFRVSTDDVRGTMRAYVGEGASTDDPFPRTAAPP